MQPQEQEQYSRLREQLEEWKTTIGLYSATNPAQQRFQLLAQKTLIPALRKLARVLEDGDLACEVFCEDDEDGAVGLRIETIEVTLRLSPSDHPNCIKALAAQGRREDTTEWLIPYRLVQTSALERELQAAVLRMLKPFITAKANQP